MALLLMTAAISYAGDNLIPNPDLTAPEGQNPYFWHHGAKVIEGVKSSEFSHGAAGNPPINSLSIKAGNDRHGEWWCDIDGIEPQSKYLLHFVVYRDRFVDGFYPEVEVFGKKIRLDNNLTYGAWQDFTFLMNSGSYKSTTLRFINEYPTTFSFSRPALIKLQDSVLNVQGEDKNLQTRHMPITRFIIGIYGADAANLDKIKALGFNTVIAGTDKDATGRLMEGLKRYNLMAVIPPTGNYAVDSAIIKSPELLGWYIEDEPEGRSVPSYDIAKKIQRLRNLGSMHPTFMAMVRPQWVGAYAGTADVILMDQYPIPDNPITWLSESMDAARGLSHGASIWAVIQAFGGQGWKGKGWGREPSYKEMKALSYLAIVHGARGLFYYTFKDGSYDMARDAAHMQDVKRLISGLDSMKEVFLSDSSMEIGFRSLCLYRAGPDGSAPVHTRLFRLKDGRLYIIAVNVLDKDITGELFNIPQGISYVDEYFSGKRLVVKDRGIIDKFSPYDVKIYTAGKKD